MSATYNWAYKPSIANKYGFTVPSGADTARPTGWCYVALFGNDATGNGSRNYPFRTLTKAYAAVSSGTIIVLASGVYREAAAITTTNTNTIIGDGDVVLDASYNGVIINGILTSSITNCGLYNLELRGNGSSGFTNTYWIEDTTSHKTIMQDVLFNGSYVTTAGNTSITDTRLTNCIIKNYNGILALADYDLSGGFVKNCTFVGCNNIQLYSATGGVLIDSCIFVLCNLSANSHLSYFYARYSLFFQCNFKLSDGISTGGVLYPSVPSGYTYYSTISALQAAYNTLFSSLSFTGCTVTDPLFNNSAIGDYSLSFSSPAKNLSYFGTYVGAKSIAYQVKASATESTGAFDFSTNVNLTVANDSITLVDTTLNAEIKTKLIINANGRQILKFPLFGFNADRNGQYVDSIADLDTVYKNPGDTLSVPTPYLVEGFAITYNSIVYQIGDRLTTVTGQTTFTSAGAGTLREILEAPERHTIMARFSDGGATVSAGDALVIGNWYYVISGSVTYDSVVYNAGQGFKAVDTNAFTGTGSVQLALSTESFQHYEPGIQPTSNNTGDIRTGSIIRGNGDPAYVRGGYGVQEFPINAKFIQLYYIINVANLKP